ncbi:ABC transporter permease [uncultured Arcticibacterium sp.]|uniref:ABC transporter permease n=1 Tax=uncultured Arcticibacterium sp. TaxID=2173042 RepID=UPI0030F7D939
MFKNYIKIALRTFRKDGSFTIINLLGLASGLAITLLIIQYVRYELSYENTHENADQIVRLTTDYMDGETVTAQDCETNPPLGNLLKQELTQVEDFTRAYPIGEPHLNVKVGEAPFILEKVFAVDTSFFSMFTTPLIRGTKLDLFKQADEAVISKTTAQRLFNSLDVIGKVIEMPNGEESKFFEVVGVTEDSPSNTHLKFDMLFSYESMYAGNGINGEKPDNWDGNNTLTYIQLAPNVDYADFTANLLSLNERYAEPLGNDRVIGQKISDIHLYSKKTFETEANGDATTVFFLLGVAFLVIISAFVNYVNLATSKSLDRAKEVGLRKVVGSTKNQLKTQFLTESLLLNIFAGLIAVALISLLKPSFIDTAGLPESFNVFSDPFFWGCLGVAIMAGVLLAGAYPAFALSSFKPVSVLKGKFSSSAKGNFMRKSLVVFQFAMTIVLLVQAFTVQQQISYLQDIDLGVDIDKLLVVNSPGERKNQAAFEPFKNQLTAMANVESVSTSEAVPGLSTSQFSTTTGINLSEVIEEHNYNFYINSIDSEYIPVMGMELLAGTNYSSNSRSENNEVIVNEEAIRLWGLADAKDAVGKELDFWGRKWLILGVIKDYHQETAKSAPIPIIHRYYDESWNSNASIKFSGGNPKEQIAEIETAYKANFPGEPFTYFFQDAAYDQQFKAEEKFQKVFNVLTIFAILIACLGLFGLASFTIAKRTKEIGIRKVIGASTSNLLLTLSADFMKTVLISMVIGIPITYFIIKKWLDSFANRIEISWWLFAIPALTVFLLVLISISAKTLKTALANPVESLKNE